MASVEKSPNTQFVDPARVTLCRSCRRSASTGKMRPDLQIRVLQSANDDMVRPRAKIFYDRICWTHVPELRPTPSVYCHRKCDPSDCAACSQSPAGFSGQSPLQWRKDQDRRLVALV